uniref:Uncharacterized protein n=1 Tax=Tetraselmis sp. GSL018 TaxID=582737 RepID=A0A061RAD3_9CHLO
MDGQPSPQPALRSVPCPPSSFRKLSSVEISSPPCLTTSPFFSHAQCCDLPRWMPSRILLSM